MTEPLHPITDDLTVEVYTGGLRIYPEERAEMLRLLQQVSDFLDDYILVFHGDTGDEDRFSLALSAVLAKARGKS